MLLPRATMSALTAARPPPALPEVGVDRCPPSASRGAGQAGASLAAIPTAGPRRGGSQTARVRGRSAIALGTRLVTYADEGVRGPQVLARQS
jgi:hypothetical protein